MAAPPRGPRTPLRSPRPRRDERPAPVLVDDAAHAEAFRSHPHKEWYTEWWYFNIRRCEERARVLGMYAASPFGLGTGAFAAMVFRPDAPAFDAMDVYPPSEVSVSSTRPDVQIGPKNHAFAVDDDTYRIIAASRDGRISWDLNARESRRRRAIVVARLTRRDRSTGSKARG